MKKRIFTIVAALLCGMATHAETVKWVVKPEYQKIVRYSEDLFKCQDENGKWLLLDLAGNPLSYPLADSITDYTGGCALLLNKLNSESAKFQILGFFSEDEKHTFVDVNGDYYTTQYSFFSEGYLIAENEKGKKGYFNKKGEKFRDFVYLEALPFSHGWAAVKKDGKDSTKFWAYISSTGNKDVDNLTEGSSKLLDATTFNEDGVAFVRVRSTLGSPRYVLITKDRFKIIEENADKYKDDIRPYDCAYSKKEKNFEVNRIPGDDDAYKIVKGQENKHGYDKSGNIIVPAQFSRAEKFSEDHFAIASLDGKKYGILKLLDGEFNPKWPDVEKVLIYNSSKGLKCNDMHFSLDMPDALSGNAHLNFNNGDGMNEITQNANDYKFKPKMGKGVNSCKLQANVTSNDDNKHRLLLWEGDKDVTLMFVDVVAGTPAVTSTYADENNEQIVKTVVTNKSQVKVRVKATLTVGDKSECFDRELKAGEKCELAVTIKVREKTNEEEENEEETSVEEETVIYMDAKVELMVDGEYKFTGKSATVKLQII